MTNDKKKSAYSRMADKLNQVGMVSPTVCEARNIEAITSEILDLKKTAGAAILTIGQRLIEAKGLLSHGEWLPWLTGQVEFSERSAQNYMRLAREWSNPQALADLGAAKALALLALPEPEREEFMAETPVKDMTSRELEKAIRERDEARKSQEEMEDDLKLANNLLELASLERDEASARIVGLEQKLKELQSRPVEVAVMEVDQEKLAAVRAETAAEMQAEIDRARAAKQKAEEKQRAAEEALAAARDQIQAFEGNTTQTGPDANEDLVMFRMLVGQARETIDKMGELLVKIHERENFNTAVLARREMVELSKYMYEVASPRK